MTLIIQAVLVMLATVVPNLVESTDLPPVPEDSNHTAKLEGSEPIPPEHYGLEPTAILPHERAYGQPRTEYNDIRYVTKTERHYATTVTRTINISPSCVPEAPELSELPADYCNGPGQFLYEPTNECFKYLNDRLRSFEDADAQCRKIGMRLAKPKNPKAIQRHLVNVLGYTGHMYIGARGDGASFKWQTADGEAIRNTDPKWWTGMPAFYITTDRCLALVAQQNGVNQGKVYYPELCSEKLAALCQREECSPQCTMGTCTGPNTCAYDPRSEEHLNVMGAETAVCPDGCGNNGQCSAQCTCSDGYMGDTCDRHCSEKDGFFTGPGNSTQCFKFFKEDMSWLEAEAKCVQEGMVLAKPIDPVSLRKYLRNKYASARQENYNIWIGARGTGSTAQWIRDGTTIKNDDPLWQPHYCSGRTKKHCLCLQTHDITVKAHPNAPYCMLDCTYKKSTGILCELLQKRISTER